MHVVSYYNKQIHILSTHSFFSRKQFVYKSNVNDRRAEPRSNTNWVMSTNGRPTEVPTHNTYIAMAVENHCTYDTRDSNYSY